MDVYLLVGNPRTRKSSLIRCLSGCFNRNVRDIQLLSGRAPIRLYARAGSAQRPRRRNTFGVCRRCSLSKRLSLLEGVPSLPGRASGLAHEPPVVARTQCSLTK